MLFQKRDAKVRVVTDSFQQRQLGNVFDEQVWCATTQL